MNVRTVFSLAIVVLLLVLYVLLVRSALSLLDCTPKPSCLEPFSETMGSALAIIGGLVSAVVIAELAISAPDKPPLYRVLGASPTNSQTVGLYIATYLYLGVWLAVGLWVVVETWQRPDTIPALTALAHSWFSLAVAAGYAFFGLKPTG